MVAPVGAPTCWSERIIRYAPPTLDRDQCGWAAEPVPFPGLVSSLLASWRKLSRSHQSVIVSGLQSRIVAKAGDGVHAFIGYNRSRHRRRDRNGCCHGEWRRKLAGSICTTTFGQGACRKRPWQRRTISIVCPLPSPEFRLLPMPFTQPSECCSRKSQPRPGALVGRRGGQRPKAAPPGRS